ncbi:MAG: HAD-IA family hydrolase [Microvirga sp.]|nr:HAD-IA family hydrolase [Microvirga sp.]
MKLVIFDVDGTLVDSQDVIVEAQARAFRAHGLEPPRRERSLSIVGLSLREAFVALAGEAGPVDGLVESYKRAFQDLRFDPRYDPPVYPGALAALSRLSRRADVSLAIATGKSRRGVAHFLERHRLEGLFASIQTADDAPSKPHPGMILRAMAETGIGPGDAAMIGDTTYDMEMAAAAGATGIGVAWGYHAEPRLRDAGAATVIARFRELDRALEAAFATPVAPAGEDA